MKLQRFFSVILFCMMILFALTPGAPASAAVSAAPADQSNHQTSPVPLLVTVLADSATVKAGDPIGFTIQVTNVGGSAANDVQVRDQLSSLVPWKVDRAECSVSSTGLLTCKFGALAPQASLKVHVSAVSNNAMKKPVTNSAEAWGSNSTKTISNQATLTVKCGPDITVTKTAPAALVIGGQPVSFTITVSNIGSLFAQKVTLTDPLPTNPGLSWTIEPAVPGCAIDLNGVLGCDFGTVDVGDQFARSVTIVSPTTRETCGVNNDGVIDNTAAVASPSESSIYVGNNTAKASIQVFCPDLEIIKIADHVTALPGDTVGFTVKVTNYTTGPVTAVELADQLDQRFTWHADYTNCTISATQALSCDLGTLAANGGSASVHVTAATPKTFCGDIVNTASVVGTGFGRLYSNEARVTIPCKLDVSVTKTAVAAQVNQPAPVSFTMTVKNESATSVAEDVTLTDPLVAGLTWTLSGPDASACTPGAVLTCNFGDLPAGATRVVTVSAPTTSESCPSVSNTATVSATGEAQEDLANNTSTAETKVYGCGPELEVIKSADKGQVSLGQTVDFTIEVKNSPTAGTAANGVLLTDKLDTRLVWSTTSPASECSIDAGQVLNCNYSSLAVGESKTVHVSAPVVPAVCNSNVDNKASALADNAGQADSDLATVIIDPCTTDKPDVSVTKTAETEVFDQGTADFRFIITVKNVGSMLANQVKLVDTLTPYPVKADQSTLNWQIETSEYSNKCTWTKVNQVITCDFGSLTAGQEITITVSSPSTQFFGAVNNKADVTAADEVNLQNNHAEAGANDSGRICIDSNMYKGYYANDFEGTKPDSTGIHRFIVSTSPNGQKFLGDYGNETVTMAFSCVPQGTKYLLVSYDLYIIHSWDGNATFCGPDHWQWGVQNGQILFNTNFTNWNWLTQSYPYSYKEGETAYHTLATGVNTLGYTWGSIGGLDATYRISALVPYTDNPEQTITFYFKGFGLQVLADESWGLDNFSVKPYGALPYTLYYPLYQHYFTVVPPSASPSALSQPVVNDSKIPQLLNR